jgi:hypothetical protein
MGAFRGKSLSVKTSRSGFRDTDGDGRISFADSTEIFVADLDGQNLSSVLPSGLIEDGFVESSNRQQLYVRATMRPKDSSITQADWPEKLFVYDIKARKLRPFSEIDSTLSLAKQILWGK